MRIATTVGKKNQQKLTTLVDMDEKLQKYRRLALQGDPVSLDKYVALLSRIEQTKQLPGMPFPLILRTTIPPLPTTQVHNSSDHTQYQTFCYPADEGLRGCAWVSGISVIPLRVIRENRISIKPLSDASDPDYQLFLQTGTIRLFYQWLDRSSDIPIRLVCQLREEDTGESEPNFLFETPLQVPPVTCIRSVINHFAKYTYDLQIILHGTWDRTFDYFGAKNAKSSSST